MVTIARPIDAPPVAPTATDTGRVLLVDDHAAFRQALAFVLGRNGAAHQVLEAGSIAEARPLLPQAGLAVVDLQLPDGDGLDLVRELRRVNPDCPILVLSGTAGRAQAAAAVEAGADGIVDKAAPIGDVLVAVGKLAEGESLLAQAEIIDLLRLAAQQRERDRAASAALQRLTPRERQVLAAVAEGHSDKEIALRFSVSHETIRTHMVNILGKLGVDSRLQAVLLALRHGFVALDE